MSNSPPYIMEANSGFKVLKKVGEKIVFFGFYKDHSLAADMVTRVAKCKNDEAVLALHDELRDTFRRKLPGAGVNLTRDDTYQVKIKFLGDFIVMGEGTDKAKLEAYYEEASKATSIAQIMEMRKAYGMLAGGRFRQDKVFKNPENELAYNAWLATQQVPEPQQKKVEPTVRLQINDGNAVFSFDAVVKLRETLLIEEKTLTEKLAKTKDRLCKLDRAMSLLVAAVGN